MSEKLSYSDQLVAEALGNYLAVPPHEKYIDPEQLRMWCAVVEEEVSEPRDMLDGAYMLVELATRENGFLNFSKASHVKSHGLAP